MYSLCALTWHERFFKSQKVRVLSVLCFCSTCRSTESTCKRLRAYLYVLNVQAGTRTSTGTHLPVFSNLKKDSKDAFLWIIFTYWMYQQVPVPFKKIQKMRIFTYATKISPVTCTVTCTRILFSFSVLLKYYIVIFIFYSLYSFNHQFINSSIPVSPSIVSWHKAS